MMDTKTIMNTIRWDGDVRELFSELETHQLQSKIDKAIENLEDCNDVTSAESQQAVEVLRKASRPISIRRTIGDYLAQKNFADVFTKLWKAHFSKFTNLSEPMVKDVVFLIRNFTTKSPNLCASLGQSGAISLLLRQLQAPNITVEQLSNEDTLDYVLPLMMIIQSAIHLCSDNRDVYRKSGAIAILSPYVQCLYPKDTELNKRMVKLGALLTLAYILNESETKRLDSADIKLCITFLHLLHAKDTNTKKSMSKSGISKVMILDGINRVALLNDENKVNLVEAGVLTLLTKVLKSADDFSVDEQILAARGLWTLSFADSNRVILKNSNDVIQGLKENSCSPNEDLSSTCNDALWEIYEGDEGALSEILKSRGTGKAHTADDHQTKRTSILDILGRSLSSPGDDAEIQQSHDTHAHDKSKIKVMISYQWDVQRTMVRVKELLNGTNKFNVWMDVDKMKGSILEAMANAIEESDVILICLSRKYKESLNCRTEASYAYKLKKPLIPLMVEDNYNPDGWLGALVGMELYYDVTQQVQEHLPSVIRAIEDKAQHQTGDVKSPVRGNPTTSSEATKPDSAVTTWSSDRIAQWLDDNDLSDLKDRFCRLQGKHLKQMYARYKRDPDVFDRTLKEDLAMDFITIVIFTTALEELFT